MAHLTRPAEISGVSAGLFPETAAGNRAYVLTDPIKSGDCVISEISNFCFYDRSNCLFANVLLS